MSLAQLFYLKESIRNRVRRRMPRKPARRSSQFAVEFLEPRLLLNATTPEQIVTPTVAEQTVAANTAVSVTAQYTTDPVDSTVGGLSMRMHFDSRQLSFVNVANTLTSFRQFVPNTVTVQAEAPGKTDSDPDTNSFIALSWADLVGDDNGDGQWPGGTLPVNLFTANFITAATFSGSTNVTFVAVQTEPGYIFTTSPAKITAAVVTGEIDGFKFNDLNANGIQEAGELGLAGWAIFLDANTNGALDAGETSTLTAADGSYSFKDLTAGAYTVREVLQSGWIQTSPTGGANTVNLTAGAIVQNQNFGNTRDQDLDGVSDFQESGGPNAGDANNDGIQDSTQANVASLLDFSGTDRITFVSQTPGTSLVNVKAVETPAGAPAGVTFPFGTFSFQVTGVTPGAGAQVMAILPAGSTVNNYYKFGPEAGNTTPHWYSFDIDLATVTGADPDFEVGLNRPVVTLYLRDGQRGDADLLANGTITDPGAFAIDPAATGTLGGRVRNDLNANGVIDSGEDGINGWTVFLDTNGNFTLDSGEPTSVTADIDINSNGIIDPGSEERGNYFFDNLVAGTYRIGLIGQNGWRQTVPPNNAVFIVNLAAGQNEGPEFAVHLNAAPINTVPGTQTTAEDTARQFNTANGNLISVTDPDGRASDGADVITVTLTGTDGTVTLASTAGLINLSGNGTGVVSFSGGTANINAALNGLSFLPTLNFNGAASLQILTSDGALSDTDTVTINVTPVNDAPVLDTAPTLNLPTILEDSGAPVGAVGSLVVALADLNPPAGGLDNVTDVDAGATLGIAVTGINDALGTLFWSFNDGASWLSGSGFSESAALLLPATARVYFEPRANVNGTIASALSFRAWDQTSGINGSVGNTSVNGGTTAFSTAIETVALTVTPVNDAPSFTKGPDQTVEEDAGAQTVANWATAISAGPADEAGQTLTFQITNNTNLGLFSVAPAVSSSGTLTYTPAANANGVADITLRLLDDGGIANGGIDTSGTQTFRITVNAVNDPPVITSNGGGDTAAVNVPENSTVVTTVTATDIDSPAPTFSISGGLDQAKFQINSATGALSFLSTPDFENPTDAGGNNVYDVIVRASDTGGAFDEQMLAVTVQNVDEVLPTLSINDVIVTEGDSGTVNAQFTVTLSQASATPVTVQFVTADGTAVEPGDYVAQALTTLTFNPGDPLTKAVTVSVQGDQLDEADETFFVNLSNATGATIADGQGQGTITDDDTSPVLTAPAAADVPENTVTVGIVSATDADGDGLTFTLTGVDAALFSLTGTGSSRTLVFNAAPNFENPLDAGQNNVYNLTVSVNDSNGNSDSQAIVVTVTNVNEPPTAVNDTASTQEDVAVTIQGTTLLANDTDPDNVSPTPTNSGLTIQSVGNAVNGTVALNGGNPIFTPNPNFNGAASFQYTITDGQLTSTATVAVTVNAVNDNPTAVNDVATVAEDSVNNLIDVLTNDLITPDVGETLTVTAVGAAANGTVTLVSGQVRYTPDANYFGPDSFTYSISDGNGGTANATVNVTVTAVPDAPVAVGDIYSTSENSPLTRNAAQGVLANDTDADNLTPPLNAGLTAVLDASTINGTLVLETDGGFTYTPNAGFSGPDSFTYHATDGILNSAVVTVTVNVGAVNDEPDAVNDTATVAEDSVNNLIDVLANDTDPDNLTAPFNAGLTVTAVGAAANGTVSLVSGQVRYTPNANFFGADSFTYTIMDGQLTDTAMVSLTVTAVNDPPVSVNDSYTTDEDTTLIRNTAQGVLANDPDIDSATLTASLVIGPLHGTLTLNPDGSFTYQPNANYNGPDSFTYKANDGALDSNVATVNLTITAVNDNPTAVADAATVAEDSVNNLIDVLANDLITPDVNETLTVTAVGAAANGTVTLLGGQVRYTPNANYFGPDSFTYNIDDGNGGTASATVNVTVTAVNDAPTAVNDTATTQEDTALTIQGTTLLANDTDIDNQTPPLNAGLTITAVNNAVNGTVDLNGGKPIFTPASNFNGIGSFQYTISDGLLTSTATVTVTITPLNDQPVNAVPGPQVVQQNTPLVFSTGNGNALSISDIDAGTAAMQVVLGVTNGTLTLASLTGLTVTNGANGTASVTFTGTISAINAALGSGVTYTPTTEFTGPSILTIDTNDQGATGAGGPLNDQDTVTINVTAQPTVSVAVDPTTGAENNAGTATRTFTVSLDAPSGLATSVNYALSGTATTGTDYSGAAATGTINFAAGETSQTVVVTVTGDVVYESDESIVLTLSNPTNLTLGTSSATTTITNDDAAPVFSISNVTANEGNAGTTDFVFTVTLTGATDVTATVTAQTADDTATAPGDYAAKTQLLTFGPQGTTPSTQTVTVNVTGDQTFEPNETFFVNLLTPVNATILNGQGLGTIVNDDAEAGPAQQIITPVPSVQSAGQNAPVSIRVDYTTANPVDPTLSGIAFRMHFDSTKLTFQGLTEVLTTGVQFVSSTITVQPETSARQDSDPATNSFISVSWADLAADTWPGVDTVSLFTANFVTAAHFAGSTNVNFVKVSTDAGRTFVSTSATINAIVVENRPPTAVTDSYVTDEDTALIRNAAQGVLANDTDPDGNTMTAVLVNGPSHGTLVLNPDGSFTYTPAANSNGSDSFTYKANDGTLDSNVATVNLTINPVNDAPVASNDSYTTDEDTPLIVSVAQGLLANDTDVDGPTLSILQIGGTGPAHGTLEVNQDGSFTYTPNANFNGTDSFVYRITDGALNSNIATVNLTINPVNDAPVITSDGGGDSANLSVVENTTFVTQVTATDVDGPSRLFSIVGGADAAKFQVNDETGNLHFIAAPDFEFPGDADGNNVYLVVVQVNDGAGGSDQQTLNVTVLNDPADDVTPNRPPDAVNDLATVAEDSVNNLIDVLANDSDPDGNTLTVTAVGQASHGTVSLVSGQVRYTANADYFGPDSFGYTISDGQLTDSATVSLTVTPVNDNPTAVNDTATVAEDSINNLIDVLANDLITPDAGETLTVTEVGAAQHGTAVLVSGQVRYTPNSNFFGSDSFSYTIGDGNGGTASATVNVTITAVNDAPVAVNDTVTTAEDTPITILGSTLLANDTDPDNAALSLDAGGTIAVNGVSAAGNITIGSGNLTIVGATISTAGTISVSQPSTTTVTLNASTFEITGGTQVGSNLFHSFEEFSIGSSDTVLFAKTTSDLTSNILVRVTGVNPSYINGVIDARPYGNAGLSLTNPNGFMFGPNAVLNAGGVLSFWTISTGLPTIEALPNAGLTIIAVGNAVNGTVELNGGNPVFTPAANFNGIGSFQYTISDGSLTSTATVTVNVTAVNDAPVAGNDNYTVQAGSTLNVPSAGVLGNDTDIDSSTLAALLVGNATHGTLSLNANGSFTYTPNAGFTGTDQFTYKANDGALDSNVATVSITVTPAGGNRNPIAVDDHANTNEDKAVVIRVLKNDSDPDRDRLTIASVTQAGHGTVEIVGKNVKYRPNANFFGTDTFTYTIQDGKGGTATATVEVTVCAVNDKPTAQADFYTVAEDEVLTVSAAAGVLANDADVDGDVLHPDLVAGPKHGTLELNEDGSFVYTPDANFQGQDFFIYNACDGELDSRPVKVLITVTPVNDAPVLQEIADRTVEEGTQLKFKAKATDVDRPKDTLTFSLADGAPAGASINAQTGEFKWTPTAQQGPGVYQITVRVTDGQATDSKTFTVTVTERLIKETLIIRGTTGCDVIKVCEEDGGLLKVDVNGDTKSYRLACGTDIKVLGLDGNDTIILKGLNRDAVVDGGNGNDLIDGRGVRSGKLTLKGGNGCDLLLGGCGNDLLDGGNGNDILIGGGGCDTLRGGDGCDVLFQGTAREAWNVYQQYGTHAKGEQAIQWWQNKSTESQRSWVRDFVAGLKY